LRAGDYHNALQTLRESCACGFFLDLSSLESSLQTLCAGHGSPGEALIVHRALDVGLLAAGFESAHGLQPAADFEMSHSVPTLSAVNGPAAPARHARA
jgi:hypothetical protein